MNTTIGQLPLFPLNTVLFPGMPLNLHIFEERYKQMVRDCQESKGQFGVVLIQQGREAGGPLPNPFEVGCLARIQKVEPLSEGRFNLSAVGDERFRVRSLFYDQPYLSGEVEMMPLITDQPELISRLESKLRPRIERYLHLIVHEDAEKLFLALPDDTISFAYVAAIILQISPQEKQTFLEILDVVTLFERLFETYLKELALVEKIIDTAPGDHARLFSTN